MILAFAMVLSSSCSKKTAGKAVSEEEAVEQDTVPELPDEVAARMKVDTLLFFKKTACFGRCPTYDVLVKTNGDVLYNGISNVEREGLHKAKLEVRQIAGLLKAASASDFYSLEDRYPVDDAMFIPDLPNTITYLKQGDLAKKVYNNNEAPEKLIELEKNLEELFNSLEYTPVKAAPKK
jgi:hypothetical protein